jgi:hypothetical protein
MKEFNFNNYIYFKPTKRAHEIYRKDWLELTREFPNIPYSELTLDDKGMTKMQFWHFVQKFGHTFFLGSNDSVLENGSLYFDEKDLKELTPPTTQQEKEPK